MVLLQGDATRIKGGCNGSRQTRDPPTGTTLDDRECTDLRHAQTSISSDLIWRCGRLPGILARKRPSHVCANRRPPPFPLLTSRGSSLCGIFRDPCPFGPPLLA